MTVPIPILRPQSPRTVPKLTPSSLQFFVLIIYTMYRGPFTTYILYIKSLSLWLLYDLICSSFSSKSHGVMTPDLASRIPHSARITSITSTSLTSPLPEGRPLHTPWPSQTKHQDCHQPASTTTYPVNPTATHGTVTHIDHLQQYVRMNNPCQCHSQV